MKKSQKIATLLLSFVLIIFLATIIPTIQNVSAEYFEVNETVIMDDLYAIINLMGTEVANSTNPVAIYADADGNGWITMSDLFIAKNNMIARAAPQMAFEPLSLEHHFHVNRELVNAEAGIHRLVFSAEAPGNFTGLNIAMSFDSEIITPVHRDSHAPFTPPSVAGVGNADPFRWIGVQPMSFSGSELTMWDATNLAGRTVFMHGAVTVSPPNIGTMTNLFAFYFHVDSLDQLNSATFSLVNKREPAFVNLLSAVSSGVELNVAGRILFWGNATNPDSIGNVVVDVVPIQNLRNELYTLIRMAELLYENTAISHDGTDIPAGIYWVPESAHGALQEAINAAQVVLDNFDAQTNSR